MGSVIKPREIAPFGVRLPADLKEYLKRTAAESCRSLNTEIIFRLEEDRKSELSKGVKGAGTTK